MDAGTCGAAAKVHHDDAVREFAYDRTSPVGKLDKALDAAREQGWTVVGMKPGWKNIFRWPPAPGRCRNGMAEPLDTEPAFNYRYKCLNLF